MHVSFDLDGTLFDTNTAFLSYVKAHPEHSVHGWPASVEEVTSWDYGVGGVASAVFEELGGDFSFWSTMALLPAEPGGFDALSFALRIGVSSYLTARPPRLMLPTLRGLELAGLPSAPVRFDEDKVEGCALFDVDVLVEDALHNANAVAEAGTHVVLLDRPYNQGHAAPNVHRAFGFADAVSIIEEGLAPILA